ncbi:MAG: PaaI family thioesterase [Clostridiales Family XIII bacterium]|jgi:uncharacterized protein (TIGR00369 family)|nr:PaaI family thioesterase [Clostridiales Family XIII bacterium]
MTGFNENTTQEKMENDLSKLFAQLNGNQGVATVMKPDFVACDLNEMTVTVECPVREWQTNPYKTMHGGYIASAFDETAGIFATYMSGMKSLVTANLSVNYLKPIMINDSILITAKATSVGKRIITVTGECRSKSGGSLTGTAQMTFAVRFDPERPEQAKQWQMSSDIIMEIDKDSMGNRPNG